MESKDKFEFDANAFLTSTICFSPLAVGAYMRLLCYQWTHGTIPESRKLLLTVTGCSEQELDECWSLIEAKFPNGKNPRLEQCRPKDNGKKKAMPSYEETILEFSDEIDSLPAELPSWVMAWLDYKAERRENYKPKGLKAMLSRVRTVADGFGWQAVRDAMQKAMSSNWKGWDFGFEASGRASGVARQQTFLTAKEENTKRAVEDFANG